MFLAVQVVNGIPAPIHTESGHFLRIISAITLYAVVAWVGYGLARKKKSAEKENARVIQATNFILVVIGMVVFAAFAVTPFFNKPLAGLSEKLSTTAGNQITVGGSATATIGFVLFLVVVIIAFKLISSLKRPSWLGMALLAFFLYVFGWSVPLLPEMVEWTSNLPSVLVGLIDGILAA